MNAESKLTSKDRKIISKAEWIVVAYTIFSGCFMGFNNKVPKEGTQNLYLISGFAILVILTVIAYIIIYIKDLWRIKQYRIRGAVIGVVISLVGFGAAFIGFDYFIDIFQGTTSVTTDEYEITGEEKIRLSFMNAQDEEVSITISETTENNLEVNPLLEENYWTENYLLLHKNSITVEYYPNSGVLYNAVVNE